MAFRYRIVKMSIGTAPYTTRPEVNSPLTEAEVIRDIEAATSMTIGDVKNALASLRRVLIAAAQSGRSSEVLFDLFRIGLSSGGALDDPEAAVDVDTIDPRMTVYLAASVQKEFRTQVKLERAGMVGDRVPQLEFVRNLATDNVDAYTPGNVLRITGDLLKVDKSDPTQGVFFKSKDDGTEIRMSQYIDNTKGTLTVLIPPDIAGPQQLIVRAKFGSQLRETIYSGILVQE